MQFFYVCNTRIYKFFYILILALTLLFFYQHNQRSAFKRFAIALASSLA